MDGLWLLDFSGREAPVNSLWLLFLCPVLTLKVQPMSTGTRVLLRARSAGGQPSPGFPALPRSEAPSRASGPCQPHAQDHWVNPFLQREQRSRRPRATPRTGQTMSLTTHSPPRMPTGTPIPLTRTPPRGQKCGSGPYDYEGQ